MSEQGKIAAAIVVLAVVVFVSLVVVPEIKERRAMHALNEFNRATQDQVKANAARVRQDRASASRAKQEAGRRYDESMRLQSDQRCVAGSVVKVTERDGVPSYAQVLHNGKLIKCAGNRRL